MSGGAERARAPAGVGAELTHSSAEIRFAQKCKIAPRNYSRLNQATFIFERSNSDKQKSPVTEGFSRAVSARMVSALRTARVCGHP